MKNRSGVIALVSTCLRKYYFHVGGYITIWSSKSYCEIHRMRKDGFSVKSQRVPMTKILARTNKYAYANHLLTYLIKKLIC